MEHLNSMFLRLKRNLSSGDRENMQPPEKQQLSSSASSSSQKTSDTTTDEGFLLVDGDGEEGTTVYSSTPEKKANSPDVDGRAREFSMFATCKAAPMDLMATADTHQVHDSPNQPATVGVPFELNPKLQRKEQILKTLSQIDLNVSQFNWQNYHYDFNFERSSLRELCAMEDRTVQRDGYHITNSSEWRGYC